MDDLPAASSSAKLMMMRLLFSGCRDIAIGIEKYIGDLFTDVASNVQTTSHAAQLPSGFQEQGRATALSSWRQDRRHLPSVAAISEASLGRACCFGSPLPE